MPTIQPKLKIINLAGSPADDDHISITKSNISIPIGVANKAQWKIGDYILIAVLGSNLYFGKRPQGFFGGHKLSALGNSNARFALSVKSDVYKLPVGHYSVNYLSPVKQEERDIHDKPHEITFYELRPA